MKLARVAVPALLALGCALGCALVLYAFPSIQPVGAMTQEQAEMFAAALAAGFGLFAVVFGAVALYEA
jgi:hypothetical protein